MSSPPGIDTPAASGSPATVPDAAALAAELAAAGRLAPDWADAWARVDRAAFVPDRVRVPAPDGYHRLDRADDPARWHALVHTDTALITQVEDGTHAPEFSLRPTSSASMPRMVAAMLAHLDVREGHRVLEIGTGVGITAALLATRLGDDAVVSIELDPRVAADARGALHRAGHHPHLLIGDGTCGSVEHAPYDRVLSTFSVHTIPPAWVAQSRPGGRIVTPWGSALYNGVLLALDIDTDTTGPRACGRVVGDAAFMWERGQGVRGGVMDTVRDQDPGTPGTTTLDARLLVDDRDATFCTGLFAPGVRRSIGRPPDATREGGGEFTLWLVDAQSRSWACVDHTPGGTVFESAVHGPRPILAEVEAALAWWGAHGRPERTRFGLTATASGQTAWLDDPSNPLPATHSDMCP
ncbi:methyltransferase domain-containing protein [Embleya scabrispora]|uniref:methyltransferase domain-containing protein n=1 Tax=Embleya scabrispora TaxID=159449 RepID=UPI00039DBF8B|nr:methyltransferase domain-containing protein [Embleya scabrispora]MYS86663.1 methyltransferase domain-containing protein [Streptomyces sp. SID5474]